MLGQKRQRAGSLHSGAPLKQQIAGSEAPDTPSERYGKRQKFD